MKILWSCATLTALVLAPPTRAEEPAKKPPKSFQVPYRLTKPKHILVRAKINGKGPYNFILDTGAPALFVATPVARKLGVKPGKNEWGTFDRFEMEGGVVLTKIRGRIQTPPQIEGMNALGLAGVELHGMIGYEILARYRIVIDFTSDKMLWTPLDYKPKQAWSPAGARGTGGLDLLGSLMKTVSSLLGTQASPPVRLRGFLGVELKDDDENPIVQSILADGPAAKAGLKVGDRITRILVDPNDPKDTPHSVYDTSDVQRYLAKRNAGQEITLTVERGKEKMEITVKLGEGL